MRGARAHLKAEALPGEGGGGRKKSAPAAPPKGRKRPGTAALSARTAASSSCAEPASRTGSVSWVEAP